MFSCARAPAQVNSQPLHVISMLINFVLAWPILLFRLATTETEDWGTVWAGNVSNQVAFDNNL